VRGDKVPDEEESNAGSEPESQRALGDELRHGTSGDDTQNEKRDDDDEKKTIRGWARISRPNGRLSPKRPKLSPVMAIAPYQ
jgi:hypothetical protein